MQTLAHLLQGALHRHGIKKQVTATVVVAKANEILMVLAVGPLAEDVRAVVYKNDELVLACKHAAASFDTAHLLPSLKAELEGVFPSHTFAHIVVRIAPHEWYDGGVTSNK